MIFAKFGNNAGLPWWIYYTIPALVTLVLPPVAFRFSGKELAQYLVLAFLSLPVIHVVFSSFGTGTNTCHSFPCRRCGNY